MYTHRFWHDLTSMVNRLFVDQRAHPHAAFSFNRPIRCTPCTATSRSSSFQRRRILGFGSHNGILWYRRLECWGGREVIPSQTNNNCTSLHDHFPALTSLNMASFRVLQNEWKEWRRLPWFPFSDTPNGHGNRPLDCQLRSSDTEIDPPDKKSGSWRHFLGSPLTWRNAEGKLQESIAPKKWANGSSGHDGDQTCPSHSPRPSASRSHDSDAV